MNTGSPIDEAPETAPEQPRARRGLAKLRGDASAPDAVLAAPAAMAEQAPADLGALTPPRERDIGTESSAEPALEPKEPATSNAAGRGILVTAGALVVALVVLLTLVLVNPFETTSSSGAAGTGSGGTSAQRLTVVRAARQFAVSFFTYDYRKIDSYFRRIEAASAGSFRADFVSKEATLKTVVAQLKTVATGQVPDGGAGLFQLQGDKATVLIAANFNASNAVTQNGQKRYRVKIALQQVKGAWLVTNFDQVV